MREDRVGNPKAGLLASSYNTTADQEIHSQLRNDSRMGDAVRYLAMAHATGFFIHPSTPA